MASDQSRLSDDGEGVDEDDDSPEPEDDSPEPEDDSPEPEDDSPEPEEALDPEDDESPFASACFEEEAALVWLLAPRSFFAQPVPLKWIVGAENCLRIVPSAPHDGQ
jgi:hypothetical protein